METPQSPCCFFPPAQAARHVVKGLLSRGLAWDLRADGMAPTPPETSKASVSASGTSGLLKAQQDNEGSQISSTDSATNSRGGVVHQGI